MACPLLPQLSKQDPLWQPLISHSLLPHHHYLGGVFPSEEKYSPQMLTRHPFPNHVLFCIPATDALYLFNSPTNRSSFLSTTSHLSFSNCRFRQIYPSLELSTKILMFQLPTTKSLLLTFFTFIISFQTTANFSCKNEMKLLLGCKVQDKSSTNAIWTTPHNNHQWLLSRFSCLLQDVAYSQPHGGTT